MSERIYWAIVQNARKRGAREWIFEDTIRGTRKEAIGAFNDPNDPNLYATMKADGKVRATRVAVRVWEGH